MLVWVSLFSPTSHLTQWPQGLDSQHILIPKADITLQGSGRLFPMPATPACLSGLPSGRAFWRKNFLPPREGALDALAVIVSHKFSVPWEPRERQLPVGEKDRAGS